MSTVEIARLPNFWRPAHGPFAIDAERASGFRYSNRAYLVQIRRDGAGTVLIDPVNHGGDPLATLAPVAEVLATDEWVLHAADQDLPCLAEIGMTTDEALRHRTGGPAGRLRPGEPGHDGGAAARPAADEGPRRRRLVQAAAAAGMAELRRAGRRGAHRTARAIAAVLEEQGKSEWAAQEFEYLRTLSATPTRRDRWRRTSGIHKVRDRRAMAAVRELWTTRDHIARRRDIAPGRILPDSAIINAATVDPKTVEKLTALPVFGGSRQRRSAQVWLDALTRARATRRPAGGLGTAERTPARLAMGPPQARGGRAAGSGPRRTRRTVATRFGARREPGHPGDRAPAVLGLAADGDTETRGRRVSARGTGPAVAARTRRAGAGRGARRIDDGP